MVGADIHHIGDTGVPGMALPQNIMAYSIAIRGERHTYHKMAQSIIDKIPPIGSIICFLRVDFFY